MQLVAYGEQDLYLTGNPQMTHFKSIYKRHTNFAMEYIELQFNRKPEMNSTTESILEVKIGRYGDLLHDMYLVFDLPALFCNSDEPVSWVDQVGNRIINYVDIRIGSSFIDRTYGDWLSVWSELTMTDAKRRAYLNMIGHDPALLNPYIYTTTTMQWTPPKRLYIPLNFWFCLDPGLAIPLVALQYDEIFLSFHLNPLNSLIKIGSPYVSPAFLLSNDASLSTFNQNLYAILMANQVDAYSIFDRYVPYYAQNIYCIANFIFLDEDERRKFSQISHEYLIPTLQHHLFDGLRPGPNNCDLRTLSNPVKEMVMTLRRSDIVTNYNQAMNYTLQPYVDNYFYYIDKNQVRQIPYQVDPEITAINANPTLQSYMINLIQQYAVGPYSTTESINANFPNYVDILQSMRLLINGNERQLSLDRAFYAGVQQFKYHSRGTRPGIYPFQFGLRPEMNQPSGTCNFSRLSRVDLQVEIIQNSDNIDYNLDIYCVTYNVLRILGGTGSLAWIL